MKWLGATAGINGFLAVAMGAFGAHVLKSWLDDASLEVFKTGAYYHLVHAIFLAIVVFMAPRLAHAKWIAGLILAGTVLFSGSLYALALSGIKMLGAITPFGGLCFMIAWLAFGLDASRS